MEIFAGAWLFVALAAILVTPLTLWLPFYMAAKARGIEKALQEIAFQIQLARSTSTEEPLLR